jgi:hypothetical protein
MLTGRLGAMCATTAATVLLLTNPAAADVPPVGTGAPPAGTVSYSMTPYGAGLQDPVTQGISWTAGQGSFRPGFEQVNAAGCMKLTIGYVRDTQLETLVHALHPYYVPAGSAPTYAIEMQRVGTNSGVAWRADQTFGGYPSTSDPQGAVVFESGGNLFEATHIHSDASTSPTVHYLSPSWFSAWQAGAHGAGARLVLTYAGDLQIQSGGTVIWHTGTRC